MITRTFVKKIQAYNMKKYETLCAYIGLVSFLSLHHFPGSVGLVRYYYVCHLYDRTTRDNAHNFTGLCLCLKSLHLIKYGLRKYIL